MNPQTSDIGREIAELEREPGTPLLRKLGGGVTPTDAGIRFFREAHLTLRHAELALQSTQESRLTGQVSVGIPPTAAAVLGLPLMRAMRERYLGVKMRLVEGLSGHLAGLLSAHRLDLAVLYGLYSGMNWSVTPLVEERLHLIQSAKSPVMDPMPPELRFSDLNDVPLLLPSASPGLRNSLDAAFARSRLHPRIESEIDSLPMLMDAVEAGFWAAIQVRSAVSCHQDAAARFQLAPIVDPEAHRISTVCSRPNDELPPVVMTTRLVLSVCARELIRNGGWAGTQANPP